METSQQKLIYQTILNFLARNKDMPVYIADILYYIMFSKKYRNDNNKKNINYFFEACSNIETKYDDIYKYISPSGDIYFMFSEHKHNPKTIEDKIKKINKINALNEDAKCMKCHKHTPNKLKICMDCHRYEIYSDNSSNDCDINKFLIVENNKEENYNDDSGYSDFNSEYDNDDHKNDTKKTFFIKKINNDIWETQDKRTNETCNDNLSYEYLPDSDNKNNISDNISHIEKSDDNNYDDNDDDDNDDNDDSSNNSDISDNNKNNNKKSDLNEKLETYESENTFEDSYDIYNKKFAELSEKILSMKHKIDELQNNVVGNTFCDYACLCLIIIMYVFTITNLLSGCSLYI